MASQPIKDLQKVKDMMEALSMRQNGFRDALFFEFSLSTGLRVSDTLSIRKRDIIDGILYIETQKTDKPRTIALNGPLLKKLEIYLEHKQPEDLLFPFRRQWAHKMMKWAADQVGLDKSIVATHTMRKTSAWRFYVESNYDLAKTQHFLGHRSPQETIVYLGINETEVNQQLVTTAWS